MLFHLINTFILSFFYILSPDEKADVKEDTELNPAARFLQSSHANVNKNTAQTSIRQGQSTSDCNEAPPESKSKVTTEEECFPEPKVPYPCFSSLSRKERAMFIYTLRNNKQATFSQVNSISSSSCLRSEC